MNWDLAFDELALEEIPLEAPDEYEEATRVIDLDLALPVDLAPILGSLRATLVEVEDFTFELALDFVSLILLPVLVSDFPARLLPFLVRDLPRDLVCDLERAFLVDLIPEVVRVIATPYSNHFRNQIYEKCTF